MIDLRSDTLSLHNPHILDHLKWNKIGDSAYDLDPYVIELENYVAQLFNMEKALFVPSGTMANQIAILSHTHPGDEIISEFNYHINYFESSQTSSICGTTLNLLHSADGKIRPEDIIALIERKPRGAYYAAPKLLHLENTISVIGGNFYTPEEIKQLKNVCNELGLKMHIDGARIFNAIEKCKCDPSHFNSSDTIYFSFTKALGCPYGSMLIGSEELIQKAKKHQKWLGGSMHQIGIMAFFALQALQSDWRNLIAQDHQKANTIYHFIANHPFLKKNCQYFGTNIINIELPLKHKLLFFNYLKDNGVFVSSWTKHQIRMVTYPNLSSSAIEKVCQIIDHYPTAAIQNSENFKDNCLSYDKK